MATTLEEVVGSTEFVGLIGILVLLLIFYIYRSKRNKTGKAPSKHTKGDDEENRNKTGKAPSKHTKGDDEENRVMGARIVELEKVNSDLRERLRGLEMEYLERQDRIKTGEDGIVSKRKELEDGLKEVYALKEMIEEYRKKWGNLSKEKEALERQVADLTAQLKEGKRKFEEERDSELKKLEDEKETIKKKAKDMVVAFKKETEEKIKSLEKRAIQCLGGDRRALKYFVLRLFNVKFSGIGNSHNRHHSRLHRISYYKI
jgi:chromosome segregation ATPase